MFLDILTTGGTLDKIYFDAKSEFEAGDPVVGSLLEKMGVGFEFSVDQLMRIDSLDMTDEHRRIIFDRVASSESGYVLITHGTDGMVKTADSLKPIKDKTIVLTGALQPAAFASNDAIFNIGCAVGAIQVLACGVYIAMNGQIFEAGQVVKNLEKNSFEKL